MSTTEEVITTKHTKHTKKRHFLSCVSCVSWFLFFNAAFADDANVSQPARPLVIAFSSLRDRPAFASVYFYRHDGVGAGQIAGGIPQVAERGDTQASLSADGKVCLFLSKQPGGFAPRLQLFHVPRRDLFPEPEFNSEFAPRTAASLSGDGRMIAYCAWDQPGQPGGWDVLLYDRQAAKFVDLPGLNSDDDEREVVVSRNGRWLAFVSNRSGGTGLSDVYLYDREARALVPLPGLSSPHRELNPALSADGCRLAFVSDRPGGVGGKDIYVYDRQTGETAALPGLNSVAHEQTPSFSPDGRFLVFVTERSRGIGERDIYLYDTRLSRFLPTPGLNSATEDFDPSIAFDGTDAK